jgi:hypothetical protein
LEDWRGWWGRSLLKGSSRVLCPEAFLFSWDAAQVPSRHGPKSKGPGAEREAKPTCGWQDFGGVGFNRMITKQLATRLLVKGILFWVGGNRSFLGKPHACYPGSLPLQAIPWHFWLGFETGSH